MTTQARLTDPVCGMRIDPTTAVGQRDYQGQTYYFCSASCVAKFDADPARYASSGSAARAPDGR